MYLPVKDVCQREVGQKPVPWTQVAVAGLLQVPNGAGDFGHHSAVLQQHSLGVA